MLKSYLKLALRNILRHKVYAMLNILGLATGFTASLLIGLYIYDEITFVALLFLFQQPAEALSAQVADMSKT